MKEEVIIISPEKERGAGGLADYAGRIVEEWGAQVQPRFLLPDEKPWSAKLPAAGGKILVHYSAYGFDRVGYPRALLHSLGDWKRSTGGLLVLMLHEIWTFWPLLHKNRLVQSLHRADLGQLIVQADAVFTSTPSQAEHLLKLAPASAVQVLPVGSNIRPRATLDGAREPGLAVLFGLQPSRIQALQKMEKDLRALAEARVISKVVAIGAGSASDEIERGLLSAAGFSEGFEMRGALREDEVSTQLATASFALSAQDELSLQKSGTFMAYAAHGLNIISPAADPMAAEPLCWLTRASDLARGISADELRARRENLRAWQERTSSWHEIARRFAEALQLTEAMPAAL